MSELSEQSTWGQICIFSGDGMRVTISTPYRSRSLRALPVSTRVLPIDKPFHAALVLATHVMRLALRDITRYLTDQTTESDALWCIQLRQRFLQEAHQPPPALNDQFACSPEDPVTDLLRLADSDLPHDALPESVAFISTEWQRIALDSAMAAFGSDAAHYVLASLQAIHDRLLYALDSMDVRALAEAGIRRPASIAHLTRGHDVPSAVRKQFGESISTALLISPTDCEPSLA